MYQNRATTKEKNIKQHVAQACRRLLQKNVSAVHEPIHRKTEKMIVSENFNLMGCKLLKVGSTNIRRVFYTLDHLSNYSNVNDVRKGARSKVNYYMNKNNKTISELEPNVMTTYTKFMFVRDPLERLLSAYRAHYPHGFFKKSKKISFKKFLDTVLSIPDKRINPHLVSFNRACNPCVIKYDFIGLLDNFGPVMRKVLRKVGAEKLIILPTRNQTYKQEKSSDVLKRYLKDVPKTTVQKVYEKYYLDYYLFGFMKPEF